MVTEVAEAIDADLRTRPQYNRNNAKEHRVDDEIADAVMMALTAIGAEWRSSWSRSIESVAEDNKPGLQQLLLNATSAYIAVNSDSAGMSMVDSICLRLVCRALAVVDDLPGRLAARLQRIENRVLSDL
jgi:hypothetical protein